MISLTRSIALLGAVLLTGCSDSDVKEVENWMAKTRAEAPINVKPLAEPKTYIAFAYGAKGETDPFNPNKLLAELARDAERGDNPFTPDLLRRKEPLELQPIDTMRMVGTMQSKGTTYALLQIDRTLHHVKMGDRLGQNFGVILSVSEGGIAIKETVKDAAGEWAERMSKLELQESKETKK